MIRYVTGDLIEAALRGDVDVIAHQCNCFNNMGRGIAPQIARKFPAAKAADDKTISGDRGKLGKVSIGTTIYGERSILVFNLYGQYGHWKRRDGLINTEYDALHSALQAMATHLYQIGGSPYIGLPKLGCGLGGGNWDIVETLIEDALADFNVTVYTLGGQDEARRAN